MNNKIKDKLYLFLGYTLSFFVIVIFITSLFSFYGKGFISKDLISYNNLVAYRTIVIDLFNHGVFNSFDFNLGIDLFCNYSFYIIGDIFSYLAVLVKASNLDSLYNYLVLLRLFFVGISFLIYSKYHKRSNISSIVGAIIYTFSIYSLYYMINEVFFLNSMILFPLLLIGIERLVNEDKKNFYILIICISFIGNFYFAIITSIFLIIYGSILILDRYKNYGLKILLLKYLETFFYSLVGILISGFIFYPVMRELIEYSNINYIVRYNYNLDYYKQFYSFFVVGMTSLTFIVLPLTIKNFKENKHYLILLFLLFLILLIPGIGDIFYKLNLNTFAWYYVIIFIISYLISYFYDNYIDLTKKDLKSITLFVTIYYFIYILLDCKADKFLLISIFSLVGYLYLLLCKFNINRVFKYKITFPVIFISLVIFNTIVYSYYFFDVSGYNYLDNVSNREVESTSNSDYLIESRFKYDLYNDLMVNKDRDYIKDRFNNKLNYGIYYSNYIDLDDYEKYSPLEKELSLYKTSAINAKDIDTKYIIKNTNMSLKIINFNSKVDLEKEYNSLDNNTIKIKLDDSINGNLFIVGNITYRNLSKKEIMNKLSDGSKYGDKKVSYNYNNYVNNNHLDITVKFEDKEFNVNKNNFVLNLGNYSGEIKDEVTITFNNPGVYKFANLDTYEVPTSEHDKDVSILNSSNFKIVDEANNYIKANCDIKENGILEFKTYFNKGIKVTVDGKEVKTFISNKYFTGIYISSGKHKIEIRYENAFLKTGLVLTVIGILLFSGIIIFDIRRNR